VNREHHEHEARTSRECSAGGPAADRGMRDASRTA
jgi:hypothetical protein